MTVRPGGSRRVVRARAVGFVPRRRVERVISRRAIADRVGEDVLLRSRLARDRDPGVERRNPPEVLPAHRGAPEVDRVEMAGPVVARRAEDRVLAEEDPARRRREVVERVLGGAVRLDAARQEIRGTCARRVARRRNQLTSHHVPGLVRADGILEVRMPRVSAGGIETAARRESRVLEQLVVIERPPVDESVRGEERVDHPAALV